MFSKTVGIIAAGISALYIYFSYYGGSLMTEPFYITAILYSLFLVIQLSEDTGKAEEIKHGIFLGIALAVTVLLRQVFLLFVPSIFLPVANGFDLLKNFHRRTEFLFSPHNYD